MERDEDICLCFHVSLRKVKKFIRLEKPVRASQISQCYGAGTGCGWCRPFLESLLAESQAAPNDAPVFTFDKKGQKKGKKCHQKGKKCHPPFKSTHHLSPQSGKKRAAKRRAKSATHHLSPARLESAVLATLWVIVNSHVENFAIGT